MMKVYETYADGSIDIEARDIVVGDTLRMIVSRDIKVEQVRVLEDEVQIFGHFLDEHGDVTEDEATDVSWPELIYTVQR